MEGTGMQRTRAAKVLGSSYSNLQQQSSERPMSFLKSRGSWRMEDTKYDLGFRHFLAMCAKTCAASFLFAASSWLAVLMTAVDRSLSGE